MTRIFWHQALQAALTAPQAQALWQTWGATAVEAPVAELVAQGLTDSQAARFRQVDDEALGRFEAWLGQEHHWLMTCLDADWPPLLAQLSDAPAMLLGLGSRALLSDPQIAIVGARHASREGLRNAETFAEALSQAGIAVTSGLAHGIDAAAHRGALKGPGGTVAVVGTGPDRVYPAANRELAHQIAEQGALVSEFPLGTPPRAQNFPRRNRIVSGLSVGTLVVEAAERSGSLITARLASQQGREVFAIPGSIHNPMARGCHRLIRQGAKLVETAQDILEEVFPQLQARLALDETAPAVDTASLSTEARQLLDQVDFDPVSLDELAVRTRWPVSSLQGALLELELAGCVEALPGGQYRRIC